MDARAAISGWCLQQQYFDFIEPTVAIALTTQNEQRLQRKDDVRHAQVMRAEKKAAEPFKDAPISLMDPPLWIFKSAAADARDRELTVDYGDVYADAPVELELVEAPVKWSDQAVDDLLVAYLEYNLKLLNGRGNAVEKQSILNWVYEPDVLWLETVQRGCKTFQIPIKAEMLPFSYAMCCKAALYHKDHLRDALSVTLKKMGLGSFIPEQYQ